MNRYFSIRVSVALIGFSLMIFCVNVFFDYQLYKEEVLEIYERKIENAKHRIINSLDTIDQIYALSEQNTTDTMKQNMDVLLDMYAQNSDFEQWDFQALQKKFGMDVFIINDKNKVIYSSLQFDYGLDFNECCPSFVNILNERRQGSNFSYDGIDLQQATGEMRTFGYMPTPDQKYLLELSMPIKGEDLLNLLHFMDIIASLKVSSEEIDSIQVYNRSGLILGQTDETGRPKKIEEKARSIFDEVLEEGVEKQVERDGKVYRYIPYHEKASDDNTAQLVIEIICFQADLKGIFKLDRYHFVNRQLLLLLIICLFAVILARLIAKPIYLAYYDSLTGLQNRAGFEVELKKQMRRKNKNMAFMMVDIDNFKLVNDEFGHIEGDFILVDTAIKIKEVIGNKGVAARLGGDEFIIVFSTIKQNEVLQLAEKLLRTIQNSNLTQQDSKEINLTISIGIAFGSEGNLYGLYDRADKALYQSKENGKNQYTIYESLEGDSSM